jgi:hypothetical protein
MKSFNRFKEGFLILSLLLVPLVLNLFIVSGSQYASTGKWPGEVSKENLLNLSASPSDNITVKTYIPEFLWIENSISLKITSNISGKIRYTLADSFGGQYFEIQRSNVVLNDKNEEKKLNIDIKPHFITLPGEYRFFLLISYLNATDDQESGGEQIYEVDFKVILGMGEVYLLILSIIFGTAILIILTEKTEIELNQTQTSSQGATKAQVETISDAPAGKIKCPNCKKVIEEGLTFCPECGNRIPEFLRFNPNQQ